MNNWKGWQSVVRLMKSLLRNKFEIFFTYFIHDHHKNKMSTPFHKFLQVLGPPQRCPSWTLSFLRPGRHGLRFLSDLIWHLYKGLNPQQETPGGDIYPFKLMMLHWEKLKFNYTTLTKFKIIKILICPRNFIKDLTYNFFHWEILNFLTTVWYNYHLYRMKKNDRPLIVGI